MKTAHSRIGVLTVIAGLGVLGCENWRSQAIRRNQDSGLKSTSNLTDVDASIPKGERAELRSGTWSPQGREIERHFGK